MNYEIRDMKPQDGAKILEIFEEGIAGGNATYDRQAPTWEAWNQKFFGHSRLVLVDGNDEVLGWAAIQPFSSRECYSGVAEVSIYLSDAVHGKGLGAMLLEKLVTESEDHGFWTLQAGIFPENHASIAIHQKLGFRIVGTREKIGRVNGCWRDVVLLERRSLKTGL